MTNAYLEAKHVVRGNYEARTTSQMSIIYFGVVAPDDGEGCYQLRTSFGRMGMLDLRRVCSLQNFSQFVQWGSIAYDNGKFMLPPCAIKLLADLEYMSGVASASATLGVEIADEGGAEERVRQPHANLDHDQSANHKSVILGTKFVNELFALGAVVGTGITASVAY